VSDFSELHRFAADLGKVPGRVVPAVRPVVERGAFNIKKDAAARVSGLAHAPAYPYSIGYEMHGLAAEIGPDKDRRQGALGNILEYGTSKNAPIPHMGPAIEAEAPKFEAALAKAAGGLL
jgi:hypothetical protein